jgi:hypothetical protein
MWPMIRMRWVRARAPAGQTSGSPGAGQHAANGMIPCSRRLLARLRTGGGEGATLEVERHLRGLLSTWRLVFRGSQAAGARR